MGHEKLSSWRLEAMGNLINLNSRISFVSSLKWKQNIYKNIINGDMSERVPWGKMKSIGSIKQSTYWWGHIKQISRIKPVVFKRNCIQREFGQEDFCKLTKNIWSVTDQIFLVSVHKSSSYIWHISWRTRTIRVRQMSTTNNRAWPNGLTSLHSTMKKTILDQPMPRDFSVHRQPIRCTVHADQVLAW